MEANPVEIAPTISHKDCWAKTVRDGEKPGINVRDHGLNVGCVAEALVELLPTQLRELLPPGAATLAALHDVGKVSPGFQQKCPEWIHKKFSPRVWGWSVMEGWRDPGPVIKERLKRIADRFQPERIILFGSHATGTAGRKSDMLSMGGARMEKLRRMREVSDENVAGADCD